MLTDGGGPRGQGRAARALDLGLQHRPRDPRRGARCLPLLPCCPGGVRREGATPAPSRCVQVHNSFGPDGRIWERILSLVPAPVLALSANASPTPLRSAGGCRGWRRAAAATCPSASYVPGTRVFKRRAPTPTRPPPPPPPQVYGERYNDLAYYVWEPPSLTSRPSASRPTRPPRSPTPRRGRRDRSRGDRRRRQRRRPDDIDDAVPAGSGCRRACPLEDHEAAAAADAKAAAPKEKLPELVLRRRSTRPRRPSRASCRSTRPSCCTGSRWTPQLRCPNLALLPEDCLELYDALVTQLKEGCARESQRRGGVCVCFPPGDALACVCVSGVLPLFRRLRQCIPSLPPPPHGAHRRLLRCGGPHGGAGRAAAQGRRHRAGRLSSWPAVQRLRVLASSSCLRPSVLPAPLPRARAATTRAISLRHVHRYGVNLIHLLREVAAAELDWALAVLRRLSGTSSRRCSARRTSWTQRASCVSWCRGMGMGNAPPAALPLSLFYPARPPGADPSSCACTSCSSSTRCASARCSPPIFFRQNQIGCEVLAKTALARLESAVGGGAQGARGRPGPPAPQARAHGGQPPALARPHQGQAARGVDPRGERVPAEDGRPDRGPARQDGRHDHRPRVHAAAARLRVHPGAMHAEEGGQVCARTLSCPAPARVQLTELCVITKKDEETIRNAIRGLDRHGAPVRKHAWVWARAAAGRRGAPPRHAHRGTAAPWSTSSA